MSKKIPLNDIKGSAFTLDPLSDYISISGLLGNDAYTVLDVKQNIPITHNDKISEGFYCLDINTLFIYIIESKTKDSDSNPKLNLLPVAIDGVNITLFHVLKALLNICRDNLQSAYATSLENTINQAFTSDTYDSEIATLPSIIEISKTTNVTQDAHSPLPTTALTNLVKQFMNNPTRIESPRRGQIKKDSHYLTQDTIITYKGNDGEYILTIEDIKELFVKRVQNGAKIFNFLLQKLNEQHYQMNTDFLLSELVDLGIYSNKDSAYRGLKTVLDKLIKIFIEGTIVIYKGQRRKEVGYNKASIIADPLVTYNKCSVILPRIIREHMPYITILPRWAYALPSENAFLLLDYIFYLARQNTKKIRERGYFTINLDTIRKHLGLPTPEEISNYVYNKLIISPIEAAITAIEDNQQNNDLNITPIYNSNYESIHEYLQKGYLEIRLNGETLEYMEQRAIDQEQERKKTEKLLKAANAKALAKKIEIATDSKEGEKTVD